MKGILNLRGKMGSGFRELGLLLFLVILIVIFTLLNDRFISMDNILSLLRNTSILGILAIGMMVVIVSGCIDLSVGSVLALTGMLSALTVQYYPQTPAFVAILIGMAAGLLCGLINGLLVAKGKIIPIIATLGTMNIFRGLTFTVAGNSWVSAHQMNDGFKAIAVGNVGPINNLIVIFVATLIIAYYFMSYSRTGRYIYAVGSNPDSAEITGIRKDRMIILSYVILGLLAGLGGVLWASRFASAQGDTAMGYELNVIAACVLGGVSVTGGVGKISGLILGVLILGVIENALPLAGVSPFWQVFIRGVIILSAIMMNIYVKRRSDSRVLKMREL